MTARTSRVFLGAPGFPSLCQQCVDRGLEAIVWIRPAQHADRLDGPTPGLRQAEEHDWRPARAEVDRLLDTRVDLRLVLPGVETLREARHVEADRFGVRDEVVMRHL